MLNSVVWYASHCLPKFYTKIYSYSAVYLFFIVERAKKCLDFAFTTHFAHLIFCSAYDSFPGSWQWWALNIASLIVMAVLGEYFCARLELREIRVADFLGLKTDENIV